MKISSIIKKRARPDLNRGPNAPQAFALSKLCNESKNCGKIVPILASESTQKMIETAKDKIKKMTSKLLD